MEPIQDLQLRQIRKFRAFPSQNLPYTEFGQKLVGISSRYGFAVIAGPDNCLISVKTSDLQALQADDFKELDTFPKRDIDFFNLQAEIYSIEFNSDGRVLAVAANTPNGPFVYVFDGFTFHPSYPQQPFPLQSMRLPSNNAAKLTAFEWNPCIPETFATSTTDGLTTIWYTINNPKSYSILGNETLKSAVTCISWSPKGKQLTVGDADGKVHQLKPELVPVRTMDAPPSLAGLGNPPYRCVGLRWLSTTEWAVVHSSTTNYLNLSLLTGKKNQPITWDSWSDVLPPLSDPSVPRSVNFLPLFDWQFVLATSTCLTNAVTFGNNGTVWKPWELPEPFVINTPLSSTHKDTFIVGSGFDFTSTKPVVIERDGIEVSPQPIIYTLTSDGVLLLYHVTSLNPARPSLNKPIEPCDLNVIKNGDQSMGYQPRQAAALTAIPSQPASTTSVPTTTAPSRQKSIFETPTTPNTFSSLAKTDSLSTPATIMQNNVVSNTVASAEAEKKKKEAELKAQADEQERQKRLAAEEEQRKEEVAEADYNAKKPINKTITDEIISQDIFYLIVQAKDMKDKPHGFPLSLEFESNSTIKDLRKETADAKGVDGKFLQLFYNNIPLVGLDKRIQELMKKGDTVIVKHSFEVKWTTFLALSNQAQNGPTTETKKKAAKQLFDISSSLVETNFFSICSDFAVLWETNLGKIQRLLDKTQDAMEEAAKTILSPLYPDNTFKAEKKVDGRSAGIVIDVKKDEKVITRYYLKTYHNAGGKMSSSMGRHKPDLRELFVYRLLQIIGVGPAVYFPFSKNSTFMVYILTHAVDGLVLIKNVHDCVKQNQIVVEAHALALVLNIKDLHDDNFGENSSHSLAIFDFIVGDNTSVIRENIYKDFQNKNNIKRFDTANVDSILKRVSGEEKIEIGKRCLSRWSAIANVTDHIIADEKAVLRSHGIEFDTETADINKYIKEIKANYASLCEALLNN